ncbi:uncharacterized protein LOC120349156 isoform X2 [Nilaparvata lugens]|nr:uncharacterized protein LOC120349156 isoform X2 [Nilaparvata lugens]
MDGDVGGRRSGLLFNVVGNVLGLLVSGARWYGLSLYLMDVSSAWRVMSSGSSRRSAGCGATSVLTFSEGVRIQCGSGRISNGHLLVFHPSNGARNGSSCFWGVVVRMLSDVSSSGSWAATDLPLGCSSPPPASKINHPVHWDGNRGCGGGCGWRRTIG